MERLVHDGCVEVLEAMAAIAQQASRHVYLAWKVCEVMSGMGCCQFAQRKQSHMIRDVDEEAVIVTQFR